VRSSDPDKRSCPARLRARCAAACAVGRSRLRAERGSALIEVLVGAVVLAIATAGILNGIDGAQSVGAKNKARSVQATLAQQDIERMRSMPVTSLDNFTQTRTLNVAGADYTVVSRTDWVSDKAGVVNCSDTSAQAEYLKLTSTVTSPATGAKTVTETGLLTPAVGGLSTATGSATVQLTDRAGLPVPAGVGVTLSGPSSQSATTNSLGCAVFGYIPTGTYNVTVPGYVAMESTLPATSIMQVYRGRATFNTMQVDRPATVRANFVAPLGQTIATSMVWDTITVKNANLIGAKKIFTRTGGRGTSVDAPNLFPFLDGVGVYAGNCAANDPSLYSTNYFNPSATRGWTALNPGDALRPVNVEMPTLRVTVNRQAVAPSAAGSTIAQVPSWTRTQLMVTQNDGTGCNSVIHQLTNTRTAATSGVSFPIAQPFGRYTLCASTQGRMNTSSTGTAIVDRRITATINLTSPIPPTANRTLTMTTTAATSGVCF
jgi:Tfp pilus assembly protein PilV